MEKKFVFRPGNYYRVEVEIRLEENRRCYVWKGGTLEKVQGTEFAASAMVYRHNSFVCGGQCLDESDILDAVENGKLCKKDKATYLEILRLWKNYHLNGMNAGCEHQKEGSPAGSVCPVCGYRYGSAWLYREIPEKDLEAIKNLFSID